VRATYRRLKPFLAVTRWQVAVLTMASALAGFVQAGILILLVRAALQLSSRQRASAIHVPVIGAVLHPTTSDLIVSALGLACFWLVLQAVLVYLPARIGTDVLTSLRTDTFAFFVQANWSLQSQQEESDLIDILTSQVVRATQAVLFFSGAMSSLFNFLALMVSAVLINALAAVTIIVAVVGLFFLLRPLSVLARHLSALRSTASLAFASVVTEAVRMTEEIQVFGVADEEQRRVRDVVGGVAEPWFRAQFLNAAVPAAYQAATMIFVILGLVMVAGFGGGQFGSLGAVVLILFRALSYSQSIQGVYHSFNDALPYMERIAEVQERYQRAALPKGGDALGQLKTIGFKDVAFSYRAGRPVLENVCFDVQAGEAIGIVGPSGAGKSTLVQLLLRLRDPETGTYEIDGRDARRFALSSWCERVAYVSQSPRLMNASVADNIRFLRQGIPDAEVRRAAELAQIHDDIVSWRDGYDTKVNERVDAISGGQRQRICLARALVARPLFLVLDEPTSALDLRSEALVQQALESLRGQVTMFIVAHRLSTLGLCDRVMVINGGRLEGFGPPDELVQSNSWYREAFELSRPRSAAGEISIGDVG
jgi:ABC-type multidrug transport system fused ATPase/permease subunit